MIVVFDTNVIVAALLTNGLCHECFRRAVRRRLLASSPTLLDELESTLRRKFVVTPSARAFLQTFRNQARLVDPAPLPAPVCRDRDDDLVLATALSAGAERIVTGDRDLLVLREYAGIRLVSPRQFIEWLDGEPDPETSGRHGSDDTTVVTTSAILRPSSGIILPDPARG